MFPSSYNLTPKPPPTKYPDFSGYGWIIVICGFILYLIVDGIAYNLGLINSAWLDEFKQNETATSWIGSIFYAVPLLSAPITAQLVENFGCKTITIFCSFISTFGFVMSSFCGSIEQLYVTVGLVAGFGVSAAYVVGILSAERWFEKHRTLAIGIVSSGTGFGTFLIAPITQRLLNAFGWRNTMYFLASLNVLMGIVGFFINEPQWIIDEMEKKKEKVKNEENCVENRESFMDHEPNYGTWRRRLSMEGIEELRDSIRSHFSGSYAHLKEVKEENSSNLEKSEVMSRETEIIKNNDVKETQKIEVMSNKSQRLQESEVMILNFQEMREREDLPNQMQKSEVMEAQQNEKSEVMLAEIQKSQTFNLHDKEQQCQYSANDLKIDNIFQNRINKCENVVDYDYTKHNDRKNCHKTHDEAENQTIEHVMQQRVQSSQDEAESYRNDQIFTISKFSPHKDDGSSKNLNIDQENSKLDISYLKIDDHNLKINPNNIEIDKNFTLSNKSFTILSNMQNTGNFYDKFEQNDLKKDVHNLKISQNIQKSDDSVHSSQNLDFAKKVCSNSGCKHKHEQNNLKINQHNLNIDENFSPNNHNFNFKQRICNDGKCNQSLEKHNLKNDTRSLKNDKHNPNLGIIITNKSHRSLWLSTIFLAFILEKLKIFKKIFLHFSNRNFSLLAVSTFAIYSLYNVPMFFMVELLRNYGYNEFQCANFISLIGISLLIGMITLGYIGDVSGDQVKNVNAACVLICGISEFLLPSCAGNFITFGICCVFFGFSFASAYVLIPKITEMIVGVDEFATAIGLNFFVQGMALLFGVPFASTIYETIGSWKIAFQICGTIISSGSIFAFLVQVKRE